MTREKDMLHWDQVDRSQRERVAAWLGDRIHDMGAEEEQIAESARMPLLAILRGLAKHVAEYSADVTRDFNAGFSVGYKEGRKRAREEADRLAALTVTGEPPDEITASVVEGEPVILAGLVKGGEAHRLGDLPMDGFDLLVAADGRMLLPHAVTLRNGWNRLAYVFAFKAAAARGALPITWYLYPEAP